MIGNVCPYRVLDVVAHALTGKPGWPVEHESAGIVQGRAIYVDGKVVTISVEHVCKHCGCHYSVEVT